jgi:hypothetical protein
MRRSIGSSLAGGGTVWLRHVVELQIVPGGLSDPQALTNVSKPP